MLEAWEVVFAYTTDGKCFDERLFDMNSKILTFKDELKKGNNPFEGVLEAHFPSVVERFLENAKIFSNQFWRLIDGSLFTGPHTEKDLVYRWHIYLMRKAFEI